MRLVASLLSLALTTTLAFADEASSPQEAPVVRKSSGLRVVKLLPETNQALLFDRNRATHVLVAAGQQVGNYTVEIIDAYEVTLFDQTGAELVLAAPAERRPRGQKAAVPADPYAEAAVPADPYDAEPVRSVAAPAPIVAGDGGVRVAAPVEAPPSFETAAAAFAAAVPDAPPAPVVTPTVISRTELNVALADFGKLATMARGGFTKDGLRLDTISEGSLFAKAGLKPADVIVAVDQTKLLGLDDAAELYSRATSTKAANISILRAGKPMTLRVLIH